LFQLSGRDVSSLGDLEKLYLINRFRYWENAVFQRVRYRKRTKDKRQIEAFFSVQIRLQAAGRVGTVSKEVAARKARSDPGALTKFYPI
jgi:hypothetical protein